MVYSVPASGGGSETLESASWDEGRIFFDVEVPVDSTGNGLVVVDSIPGVGSMYLDICNNRKGICYAYLIDYYLTGTLENKERLNSEYPEETIKNIPGIEYFYHRIFDEAIIVKRDDSGRIVEAPLNPDDLVVIYEQYSTWWRRYRKLPLKKLRKQYKANGGIISYPYTWI